MGSAGYAVGGSGCAVGAAARLCRPSTQQLLVTPREVTVLVWDAEVSNRLLPGRKAARRPGHCHRCAAGKLQNGFPKPAYVFLL